MRDLHKTDHGRDVSCALIKRPTGYVREGAMTGPILIGEDGNEKITGYPYGPDFNVGE